MALIFLALLQTWWEPWDLNDAPVWELYGLVLMLVAPAGLYLVAHLIFPDPMKGVNFLEYDYGPNALNLVAGRRRDHFFNAVSSYSVRFAVVHLGQRRVCVSIFRLHWTCQHSQRSFAFNIGADIFAVADLGYLSLALRINLTRFAKHVLEGG